MRHADAAVRGYQRRFRRLRQTAYLRWPQMVHLETQALCNARCRFCPTAHTDRPARRMTDELIAKVIGDLSDIPCELPFTLSPFLVNEPFLDDRLFDILREVNRELPNARIRLATNGTPLDERKLARLSHVRNVASVTISVNHHVAVRYEEDMRLPFRLLRDRLRLTHEWKHKASPPVEVVLSRIADGTEADAAFRRWVETSYPLFGWILMPPVDWIAAVPVATAAAPQAGCLDWYRLSITADGTVALCCLDAAGAFAIGDAAAEHLLAIYSGPAFAELRYRRTSRSEVAPCNGCSRLGAIAWKAGQP